MADKLAPRDKRWYVWLPAIAGFISVPFMAAVYLADTPIAALSIMIIPGLLFHIYLGNTIATTHGLVCLPFLPGFQNNPDRFAGSTELSAIKRFFF